MPDSALQRKADAFVGKFQTAFLRALRQGQRLAPARQVKTYLDAGNSYAAELIGARGIQKVDEVLKELLPDLVMNLLVAAGNVAGAELPLPPIEEPVARIMKSAPARGRATMRFDKTNPDAIAWAQRFASDLIRDITAESRDAINHVIAQRLASGASTAETARAVQMSVGLTEPHAAAVAHLGEKLAAAQGKVVKAGALQFRVPMNGMTAKQIDAAMTRYADRLTKARARNIARTSTRKAASEGQRQAWRQARGKGLLTGREKRMWIASANACPICRKLDGETATLEGRFPGGYDTPPAHGSCTCTQSLSYD